MIINLLNRELVVYKSWILLYNTYADEKFEEEVTVFNEKKGKLPPMPTVTKAYGSIMELVKDPNAYELVSNINPYDCSIFDLKTYIHYLSKDEKFSPPKQFLFYPGGKSSSIVKPIGTERGLNAPDYDLKEITVQKSDDFENFSSDFSVVPSNLTELNVISFEDFFDTKELHPAKKHQYGNIKLFFPIIYNILTTYLNGEYKKTYNYLFVDKSITGYSIMQNQAFFETAASAKGSKGGISSRLRNVNIHIPIVGTQKKIVNCRNIFDLLPLTTSGKGAKSFSIPYTKLVMKTNGKFYTALRERTDIPSQIKKIDDKNAKQIFNRMGFTEMVQFRVEKQDYYYNVYIDEGGNFIFNFFFSDAIFFTFQLLDIIAKEEYRQILGLISSDLMSSYIENNCKSILKNFAFTIRSSLVEFTFEDPDVSIDSFREAMSETSVETNIIGVESGNFYVKKGLSTFSQQVPYSVLTNRFEYDTKISDLRKQSSIVLEYLNKLTISIANVKSIYEEDYIKRLFMAISTRTSKDVTIASGSNIKKLRSADPKTFKPPGDFVYSKGCQKKRQPVYIENSTYSSMSDKEKERVFEIKNHTTGKTSSYFCPTEEFPHLNFITGHPDSFCAPCCQVKKEDPEIMEGCRTTGILPGEKRKSKKSLTYAYIPTAGNNVERTRVYNITEFTDMFDLRGVALNRKIGNFTLPSLDAMMIYFEKELDDILSLSETPKELSSIFTEEIITTIDPNDPILPQQVDTLWSRLGITPVYVFALKGELSIKTVPGENEKYVIIYKSSPAKKKKSESNTKKAQEKLRVKQDMEGGAQGENWFIVTKGSTPYFSNSDDCTFTSKDDIINLLFAGKKKKSALGLSDVENLNVKYQVVDNQDKVIGVVLNTDEFISVTKSFPNIKIAKVLVGEKRAGFVSYKNMKKILEDLDLQFKRIVFDKNVIGFRVGDLDVFCEDGPSSNSTQGTVTVGYNTREFFRSVLWGTKKNSITLMPQMPTEIEDRAKSALYKKYVYSIILLQIAELDSSIELPKTIEETKSLISNVVTFSKKASKGFPIGNLLHTCSDNIEYCENGKVVVDSRFSDELTKILFYDITKNNVIQYVKENINSFKIINRYRFTKRLNEKITFYEVE